MTNLDTALSYYVVFTALNGRVEEGRYSHASIDRITSTCRHETIEASVYNPVNRMKLAYVTSWGEVILKRP